MASIRPLTAVGVVVTGLAASAGLQQATSGGSNQTQAQIAALLQDLRQTPIPASANGSANSTPAAATGASTPVAALAAAAAAQATLTEMGGRVKILSVGATHLQFDSSDETYRTLLFLRNAGVAKELVTLQVEARDPKENSHVMEIVGGKPIDLEPSALMAIPLRLKLSKSEECPAGSAETGPFGLAIQGKSSCYPLTAIVMMRNKQVPPPGKEPAENPAFAVSLQAPPNDEMQSRVIWRAFLLSLACVVIGLVPAALAGRWPWSPVAGSPDWDFGKSWSANATLFMGLLNALLAFGGLPAQTSIMPKNSYLILSLLAVAMIGVGPMVYAAIQWKDGTTGIRQGVLFTLYLAGLIVLWAAYIQFGLVWLIFAELVRADVLTAATNTILDWMMYALAGILFVYGAVSLGLIASETDPAKQKATETKRALDLNAVPVLPAAVEPPTWHLL